MLDGAVGLDGIDAAHPYHVIALGHAGPFPSWTHDYHRNQEPSLQAITATVRQDRPSGTAGHVVAQGLLPRRPPGRLFVPGGVIGDNKVPLGHIVNYRHAAA